MAEKLCALKKNNSSKGSPVTEYVVAFRSSDQWYLKLITIVDGIPSATYAPGFNQYAEGLYMKAAAVSNGYTDIYAKAAGKFYLFSGTNSYSEIDAENGTRIAHLGNYQLITVVYQEQ